MRSLLMALITIFPLLAKPNTGTGNIPRWIYVLPRDKKEVVKNFLDQKNKDGYDDGGEALRIAAGTSQVGPEELKEFVTDKTINSQDKTHGYTALMCAVEYSPRHSASKVLCLLEQGADTTLKNNSGETLIDVVNRVKKETQKNKSELAYMRGNNHSVDAYIETQHSLDFLLRTLSPKKANQSQLCTIL